jgi:serine/threonine-protein kinase
VGDVRGAGRRFERAEPLVSVVRAGVPITHRDQLPSSSRYELLVKIASGGMATVYLGRLSSAVGITRLVAVKRAHAHLLEDPAFAKLLIAEAKLASRIHHPNVVAVHNVEEIEGELLLVMDYVEGASLSDLMGFTDHAGRQTSPERLPPSVAARVILDACAGLNAAHELTDDDGRPLGIVHRDVSPHNILVGVDGVARLTDVGIAKSSGGHTQSAGRTSTGVLRGKVAYMAPEYVESGLLDARSDVFALGIVAWEALTQRRLFRGTTDVESLRLVIAANVPRASAVEPSLGPGLDAVLAKALARDPADRFATAAELGEALESAARRHELLAKHSDVAAYVRTASGEALAQRRALVRERHDAPAVTAAIRGRHEVTASLVSPKQPRSDLDETEARQISTIVVSASTPRADADASTFGSGVSAQLVDEVRKNGGPASASRSRALSWSVAAMLVAAGGAAVLIVQARSGSTRERSEGAATTSATAPATSASTSPPAASAASAPTITPSAPMSASRPVPVASNKPVATQPSKAPQRVGAKPPASPAASAAPRPAVIKTPPPEPPAEEPAADKAPPNPYAH